MNEVLAKLNECCGWDCVLKSYDGWNLHLWSGTSAEAATPLAIFSGVSYISCADLFSHPKFSIGLNAERDRVSKIVSLSADDHVFKIEAETSASLEPIEFIIVASSLRLGI